MTIMTNDELVAEFESWRTGGMNFESVGKIQSNAFAANAEIDKLVVAINQVIPDGYQGRPDPAIAIKDYVENLRRENERLRHDNDDAHAALERMVDKLEECRAALATRDKKEE